MRGRCKWPNGSRRNQVVAISEVIEHGNPDCALTISLSSFDPLPQVGGIDRRVKEPHGIYVYMLEAIVSDISHRAHIFKVLCTSACT